MDLIQLFAFVAALGEGIFAETFFAGAFDQVADFEVVFVFEFFWGHEITNQGFHGSVPAFLSGQYVHRHPVFPFFRAA